MPALFIFLFKVNIALVLFCLGYYIVLRHLTFYTLNRIYLVIAILFSTLYPNINLSDFVQRHQQLTQPVQTIVMSWKAPAENFVKPLYEPNYWQWVEVIFWAGVVLFAARLVMQLFSLYKLYRQSRPGQVHDHPVRLIMDDIGPFSFWRSIYINPAKISPADLKSVLEHEQVHVSEWHTVDILLAELSTIFYWFNPGVWLMKKAVRENIEFITDQKILKKGTDSKQYQYSLVSVSLAAPSNTLVNNFNMSTIKKRIIMMNSKRSSGYNLTRYLFLVPAVVALLLIFSLSKAEISKKGQHTLKSIATAITNTNLASIEKPHVVVAKVKAAKPAIKIKAAIKNADTIYAGKSKNGNKTFMVTGDTNPDSVNYFINGVKSTKAAVKALDPERIYSIDMMDAKYARKFVPELTYDNKALFVTTDDSETGKALKEKFDKSFRTGTLARAKNMSVGGSNDAAPVAVGSGSSVGISNSSDETPAAASGSDNDGNTSVIIVSKPEIKAKINAITKKNIAYAYSVNADAKPETVYVNTIKGNPGAKLSKPIVYKIRTSSDEATIDGPGKPLFIIDGKEVKTIKNISPEDIKSISILKDGSAEDKYGEKGKNGVIVITTMKRK